MKFHAQPYDITAKGFYFDTYEEWEEKYKAHLPVEEYEIQVIELGEWFEAPAFQAIQKLINQGNIEQVIDDIINRINCEPDAVAISFLHDRGCDLDDIISKLDDVIVREGTAKDYAYEYVEECVFTSDTPEVLKNYFDYEAFARDLQIGGDVEEMEGGEYTVVNASEF